MALLTRSWSLGEIAAKKRGSVCVIQLLPHNAPEGFFKNILAEVLLQSFIDNRLVFVAITVSPAAR